MYELKLGNCLDVMKEMPDNSVDAIVTDPPYALPGGFMGKSWDNHDGRYDTGFGYWLAGFTDGEGCFRVQRHERGTHVCCFQIKLRRDDKSTLERIKRFVGHGVVRDIEGDGASSPQSVYVVQDKDGCEALVGLFRKYPLTAKKANDFEVWAESVGEWIGRLRGNRWVGQSDQTAASVLKNRLENVRKYTDVPWSGHKFQDWCRQWSKECLRVLKPGGHMLSFGAPRQYHRLTCGIEDAGFEIRDCLGWLFGSGFPKSHNLSGEHKGWGTALKPAWESIVLARKPLVGTVAANVEAFGTGGLNIDGCRVGTETITTQAKSKGSSFTSVGNSQGFNGCAESEHSGRWPANLIHDGSDEVVGLFPQSNNSGKQRTVRSANSSDFFFSGKNNEGVREFGDSGSAARFFYCAKSSKKDRNNGLDGTRMIKYNIPKGVLSCEDVTELVQLLKRVTSESIARWSIAECGESIMGLCLSDTLSTTLTEIRKTTELKTLLLSRLSNTSEYTVGVSCETESGGNLVVSAESSRESQLISTKEKQAESVRGVKDAVLKTLSFLSEEGNWKEFHNFHSTVKPTDLMRYLVRLVTPTGGTVLDPFMGSGSTGKAAVLEGFNFIGIEMEPEYLEIAKARIEHVANA